MSHYKEYYKESINKLTLLIKEEKNIPTEKTWNLLAREKGYLTSQSLGYISEMKFSDLCKKIYKEIQKQGKKVKK